MALDYPDIIGEYIPASERFEVNGLQYVGQFQPAVIKAGETTRLHLYLQNIVDAPLKVAFKLILPQAGRFRGQPVLKTKETEIELALNGAEVGRLTIPLTTTEKVTDGQHALAIEVKVQQPKGARRIRKPKAKQVKIPFLDNLVGLDLISVLGTSYTIKNGKRASFNVSLSEDPGEPGELPNLESAYHQLWNFELAKLMHKARGEVNEGRVRIIDDLQVEPLFTALYAENTERFADSGLPLRVGEAIAIGKLLTYTVHFFLGRGPLQDGLLYPIWERALANEYATGNTIEVIKYAGYKHIVRLAAALSFGLIAETAGKHLWSQQERREVGNYIANALDEGDTMLPDFLYLPLMIGALKTVTKVRLPGEDIGHTLHLIQKARQERPDVLRDEDLARADKIFNHLLEQTIASAKA